MKYNRRDPIDCKALGDAEKAWFYVNEGSITVVLSTGGQATITREQLEKALVAMRPVRYGAADEIKRLRAIEAAARKLLTTLAK